MAKTTGSPTGFSIGASSLPFLHAEVVLKGANVLMYADDVTVFIQDQQQVQTLVKG